MATINFLENTDFVVRLEVGNSFYNRYNLCRRNYGENEFYFIIWHRKTSPASRVNLFKQIIRQLNGKKQKARLHRYLSSIFGRNVSISSISLSEDGHDVVLKYNC